ncbi:hypothetical protein MTP04_12090 [Lysinibacillus sp. PLM2]|nr:hypothetical protein MTP04_12090 [Lysinibacillus sp. PLM2]
MKKTISLFGILGMLIVVAAGPASAYNAKFDFDMNTGLFHGTVYSDPAYKYTKNEDPYLEVDYIESKVRTKFTVVNSDGDARSETLTTRSAISTLLDNQGMAQNYQYRMSAQTDDGSWYNRYNVTGSWNPDSY